MFLYYFTIGLQIFCFYHIYKNRSPYYWVFLILFIPLIASIIYLFRFVFNESDADKVKNDITNAIYPTKRVKDLEKKLQFSDTYTNRINLADAYYQNKNFESAIENYKASLTDTVQDDLYARQQLILCFFQIEDYEKVIENAEMILNKPEFQGSKQQFCYGLALKQIGKNQEAEHQLKQIDKPYSNYDERLELAKFYLENDRKKEAKTLLNEIFEESQNLTKPNRKIYRNTIAEVERLLKSV